MTWGFERGRVYNRRRDVHVRFAGQQQGGIITPARFPLVIIITGEEGLEHGYADRRLPDGTFEYFGEGQLGDMQMLRGNAAIANHSRDGRDLLLFTNTRGGLRFEGALICEGYHRAPAPDREGTMRQAIVFELRPLDAIDEALDALPVAAGVQLDELRRRAFAAANVAPGRRPVNGSAIQRSRDVRDYVVARAVGHCEGCTLEAPFVRPNGIPYLEPHHIRRLGDGGPDDPRFVIALCPTCHRRVHFGADGEVYNTGLLARMRDIERD